MQKNYIVGLSLDKNKIEEPKTSSYNRVVETFDVDLNEKLEDRIAVNIYRIDFPFAESDWGKIYSVFIIDEFDRAVNIEFDIGGIFVSSGSTATFKTGAIEVPLKDMRKRLELR